jgi:HEAT repeat protein
VDANAEVAARALVPALKDKNAYFRMIVAEALWRIGTAANNAKVVVPVLREALKDEDSQVRAAVAEVLRKIASETPKTDDR